MPTTTLYTLGVDLGQAHDHTALVLLAHPAGAEPVYQVVHAQRFPLGTPYTQIVERILAPLAEPPLTGRTTLAVDAAGPGTAVLEQLTPRLPRGTRSYAITITGGTTATTTETGITVPKTDLITTTQLLFEQRRVGIAERTSGAADLIDELSAYTVTLSAGGHASYHPAQPSGHDDLVLALALACWTAEHKKPPRPLRSYVPRQTIPTLAFDTLNGMRGTTWPNDPYSPF
jgi:hypothetical protein